jgi:hypothetical protein
MNIFAVYFESVSMPIQQFAFAARDLFREAALATLQGKLASKIPTTTMHKAFMSCMFLTAAVAVGTLATITSAQNQQGSSVNTPPQAQTPAQRENYDPLLDLPPLPKNQVTLIGGTVSGLDEVMNRMIFQPFGEKRKMNVAFDTRTRFYRDGQPITYREIKQGQRVYLDTMLNGSKVFAKSIWIQSAADNGVGRGQIVEFDAQHNTLTVRDELSSQSIEMRLTPSTVIRSADRTASTADLVPGALVSLSFGPQQELREVTLSAKPGSTFTFAGRVSYLDLSRKIIAIDNQSDKLKYDVSIDAIAPNILRQLHEGDSIAVMAVFDGARYDARRIDLPSRNQP